ncbi:hypothetical protein CFN78_10950 [Amycolatopsis antarctica]|uniref:Uncharacterized protein n=2 Tax=Amycolatopsis antarctica TaxID=1854586 RepID=A0A263D4D6_9PSEU|nr:hypothetical protein CFN78_10950 [Amycolatopsis antarctica]
MLVLSLTACEEKEELDKVLSEAGDVTGTMSVCVRAMGSLVSLDPGSADADGLGEEAARKAKDARELGEDVDDAELRGVLTEIAESYESWDEDSTDVQAWIDRNEETVELLDTLCSSSGG